MEVLDFSYFSPTDPYDLRFRHAICWSRVYEYPFVLKTIRDAGLERGRIHNASWGCRDIHVVFKTWLDALCGNVTHSDVIPSTLWNTELWDITKPYGGSRAFDAVINVSTLEEVPADHVEVLKNHFDQLDPGGLLIVTFDVPGLQLDRVEEHLGRKIASPPVRLNPRNSALPDFTLGLPDSFNVGRLVIRK